MREAKNMSEPFLYSRAAHPADTTVRVGGVTIGDGTGPVVIAGPCTVESRQQLFAAARAAKEAGASMLRGGAFKQRTSPCDFAGSGEEALRLLAEARAETGFPS
jgi:3-deoxy-7-phosphoheptulonate synthase